MNKCQSCGMSIDNGIYCEYCVNEDGELQEFEVRFEKMVQWIMKKDEGLSRETAEERTKSYMRTMPAWENHPKLAR